MASRHSSLAPARTLHKSLPPDARPRRSSRFRPKRDALTRVRHDLRSLVHTVVGYSDLLAAPHYGSLSPDQARFVSHVRSAAEQLEELVDTCIELSRPTSSEPLASEPPRLLVSALLRRLSQTMGERGCTVHVRPAPELAARELTLDLTLLERAVRGLALVLSDRASAPCTLRVLEAQGRLRLDLRSESAGDAVPFAPLDTLEDQLENRSFVRLKLSEVLLTRVGMTLRMTPALDAFELTLL